VTDYVDQHTHQTNQIVAPHVPDGRFFNDVPYSVPQPTYQTDQMAAPYMPAGGFFHDVPYGFRQPTYQADDVGAPPQVAESANAIHVQERYLYDRSDWYDQIKFAEQANPEVTGVSQALVEAEKAVKTAIYRRSNAKQQNYPQGEQEIAQFDSQAARKYKADLYEYMSFLVTGVPGRPGVSSMPQKPMPRFETHTEKRARINAEIGAKASMSHQGKLQQELNQAEGKLQFASIRLSEHQATMAKLEEYNPTVHPKRYGTNIKRLKNQLIDLENEFEQAEKDVDNARRALYPFEHHEQGFQ
jgi:hypothetical protein